MNWKSEIERERSPVVCCVSLNSRGRQDRFNFNQIMPGSEVDIVAEAPETTEPIVAKTLESVKGEEENVVKNTTEEETEVDGENQSEDNDKGSTNGHVDTETSESNTDTESTTEKRSADDQEIEDGEGESPSKKVKTDSKDAELSNGADETEEPTESA